MALRVALIGCGGAAWSHVRGWLSLGGRIRLVGLADPDVQRRRSLRAQIEQLRGPAPPSTPLREFDDYHELFEELKPDAVDIVLPHHAHKDCILAACRHSAHWLCEKPLCITMAEADEIRAAMQSTAVTGMCAHNQIFMPALAEAKRLLNEGYLGRIYTIISQDAFILGQPPAGSLPGAAGDSPVTAESWRADPAKMGGGELIDTGYHPCYRLLYLAGEMPEHVIAITGRYRVAELGGEDTAVVLCRFPGGATGLVRTSWAMELPAGHYPFHVIGEKGEVYGGNQELYFQPLRMQPAKVQFPEVDTFVLEVRHFVECIEQGKRPVQSYEDGIAVLGLIQRAYQFVHEHGTGVQAGAPDERRGQSGSCP